MYEFLDLLKEARAIIFKVVVKALAKELINRYKNRTAPTADRDGSNESN